MFYFQINLIHAYIIKIDSKIIPLSKYGSYQFGRVETLFNSCHICIATTVIALVSIELTLIPSTIISSKQLNVVQIVLNKVLKFCHSGKVFNDLNRSVFPSLLTFL